MDTDKFISKQGPKSIDMPEFKAVIQKEDIRRQISAIAERISNDYRGKEVVLIGVLKGAFIFLADLVRLLDVEKIQIDFLQASSYGADTVSSEKVVLKKDIDVDIRGKDVLLVEDIVDSGITLASLIDHLKSFGPSSVKVCSMIDKHERRKIEVTVDYACAAVDEGFLVGYGLDYAEYYRNLPEIYHMKL
jgi:hypoxanthine phosphoribosyltransferase